MKNTKARLAAAQLVGLLLLAIPLTARAVDVGGVSRGSRRAEAAGA
jgi:hypothetical protein